MKKVILFVFTVLTAMLVQAKNHTIVVNGHTPKTTGNTEVAVDRTENGNVITITPAIFATTITVTIKDEYGEVIAEGDISATSAGVYEMTSPGATKGAIIEVSDDSGVVYSYIE